MDNEHLVYTDKVEMVELPEPYTLQNGMIITHIIHKPRIKVIRYHVDDTVDSEEDLEYN